jgi:hypothetical protein
VTVAARTAAAICRPARRSVGPVAGRATAFAIDRDSFPCSSSRAPSGDQPLQRRAATPTSRPLTTRTTGRKLIGVQVGKRRAPMVKRSHEVEEPATAPVLEDRPGPGTATALRRPAGDRASDRNGRCPTTVARNERGGSMSAAAVRVELDASLPLRDLSRYSGLGVRTLRAYLVRPSASVTALPDGRQDFGEALGI